MHVFSFGHFDKKIVLPPPTHFFFFSLVSSLYHRAFHLHFSTLHNLCLGTMHICGIYLMHCERSKEFFLLIILLDSTLEYYWSTIFPSTRLFPVLKQYFGVVTKVLLKIFSAPFNTPKFHLYITPLEYVSNQSSDGHGLRKKRLRYL